MDNEVRIFIFWRKMVFLVQKLNHSFEITIVEVEACYLDSDVCWLRVVVYLIFFLAIYDRPNRNDKVNVDNVDLIETYMFICFYI